MVSAKSDYITAFYDYNRNRASLYDDMGIPVDLDVEPYRKALEEPAKKGE